jgi:hypothetical protein
MHARLRHELNINTYINFDHCRPRPMANVCHLFNNEGIVVQWWGEVTPPPPPRTTSRLLDGYLKTTWMFFLHLGHLLYASWPTIVNLTTKSHTVTLSCYFWTCMGPRNRFQGMNSASLCSLAGRYNNPIPTPCLAPIDFLKIPVLVCESHCRHVYSAHIEVVSLRPLFETLAK